MSLNYKQTTKTPNTNPTINKQSNQANSTKQRISKTTTTNPTKKDSTKEKANPGKRKTNRNTKHKPS